MKDSYNSCSCSFPNSDKTRAKVPSVMSELRINNDNMTSMERLERMAEQHLQEVGTLGPYLGGWVLYCESCSLSHYCDNNFA